MLGTKNKVTEIINVTTLNETLNQTKLKSNIAMKFNIFLLNRILLL